MKILALKTDQPETQIVLLDDYKIIDQEVWMADRSLAVSLNARIKILLDRNSLKLDSINGLIFFKGPGSFTGLRIGVTVLNTLVYSLKIPIVGQIDADWIENGVKDLLNGQNDQTVLPFYGSEAHITQAKK